MINFSLLGGFDPTNPPGVEIVSERAKLLFNDTTPEYIYKTFRLPDTFVSTPVLVLQYAMASATSGNVVWACEVMAVTPEDSASIDTDSYDTVNSVIDSVPGTAGYLKESNITLTNFDSAAPGDWVTIKIYRNASSGSDTATGDAGVVSISLNFTSSASDWVNVYTYTVGSPAESDIQFFFDDSEALRWEFIFLDLIPGTDAQRFLAQFTRSSGSPITWDNTGYIGAIRYISSGTSGEENRTTSIPLAREIGNAANEQAFGTFTVWKPYDAAWTYTDCDFNNTSGGGTSHKVIGSAHLTQAEAVTGVKFFFETGNISNGTMIVRKWKP